MCKITKPYCTSEWCEPDCILKYFRDLKLKWIIISDFSQFPNNQRRYSQYCNEWFWFVDICWHEHFEAKFLRYY